MNLAIKTGIVVGIIIISIFFVFLSIGINQRLYKMTNIENSSQIQNEGIMFSSQYNGKNHLYITRKVSMSFFKTLAITIKHTSLSHTFIMMLIIALIA